MLPLILDVMDCDFIPLMRFLYFLYFLHDGCREKKSTGTTGSALASDTLSSQLPATGSTGSRKTIKAAVPVCMHHRNIIDSRS